MTYRRSRCQCRQIPIFRHNRRTDRRQEMRCQPRTMRAAARANAWHLYSRVHLTDFRKADTLHDRVSVRTRCSYQKNNQSYGCKARRRHYLHFRQECRPTCEHGPNAPRHRLKPYLHARVQAESFNCRTTKESYAPDESAAIAQLAHSVAGALDVLSSKDMSASNQVLEAIQALSDKMSDGFERIRAIEQLTTPAES